MDNWRLFEKQCIKLLNETFNNGNIHFKGTGMSDSTKSDILVEKDGCEIFSIEAKMDIAQSGQFVLLPKDGHFEYSTRNKSKLNQFSKIVLDYINNNYDKYKDVGTASLDIDLPHSVFENWITNYYRSKNVKYIITSIAKDKIIIFPLDKFGKYFNITAAFRRKTSGSSDLPKSHFLEVKGILENLFSNVTFTQIGKKYYCELNQSVKDKYEFAGSNYRYMLRTEDNNRYLIRKLSNTKNPNVIFSIKYNGNYDANDIEYFKNELR